MIEGANQWVSTCRERGCIWAQEKDMIRDGWWLYHKSGDGEPVSQEDRLFISAKDVASDYGKVQQAVLGYYDAHHSRVSLEDFDEERERARLVPV